MTIHNFGTNLPLGHAGGNEIKNLFEYGLCNRLGRTDLSDLRVIFGGH